MDAQTKLKIERFTAAAEVLLDRGTSKRPGGSPETLFAGGPTPSRQTLAALSTTAGAQALDIVYMVFDLADIAKGPTSLMLITPRLGVHTVRLDCHLWAPMDGGRLVIVRRGSTDTYYDFDHDELVQRKGGLAFSLDDGFVRAAVRLRDKAATMPGG